MIVAPCRRPGAAALCLVLGSWVVPAGCGSAGEDEPRPDAVGAETARESPAGPGVREAPRDDWFARYTRARQPQLAALIESTGQAARERPADGLARCEYGWALFQNGRVEEALVELKQGVQLSPGEYLPHLRLGLVLFGDSQHAESSALLERALELSPGDARDAEAHFVLGAAYERLGRVDAALEQFRLAGAADPRHADSFYHQGLLVLGANAAEAARLFEQVLLLNAYHPGACINLARLYRKAGRGEDAQEMLRRHREIALLSDLGVVADPLAPPRFVAESGYYARQNKRDQALAVLARGLEHHPSDTSLWLRRGRLLGEGGDVDAARAAFETACDLAPDDPGPPVELADLYLTAGGVVVPDPVRGRLALAAQRWPQVREQVQRLEAR